MSNGINGMKVGRVILTNDYGLLHSALTRGDGLFNQGTITFSMPVYDVFGRKVGSKQCQVTGPVYDEDAMIKLASNYLKYHGVEFDDESLTIRIKAAIKQSYDDELESNVVSQFLQVGANSLRVAGVNDEGTFRPHVAVREAMGRTVKPGGSILAPLRVINEGSAEVDQIVANRIIQSEFKQRAKRGIIGTHGFSIPFAPGEYAAVHYDDLTNSLFQVPTKPFRALPVRRV